LNGLVAASEVKGRERQKGMDVVMVM